MPGLHFRAVLLQRLFGRLSGVSRSVTPTCQSTSSLQGVHRARCEHPSALRGVPKPRYPGYARRNTGPHSLESPRNTGPGTPRKPHRSPQHPVSTPRHQDSTGRSASDGEKGREKRGAPPLAHTAILPSVPSESHRPIQASQRKPPAEATRSSSAPQRRIIRRQAASSVQTVAEAK